MQKTICMTPNFYAVRIGRRPGIYTDWARAQKEVLGYSGAVFKKFESEHEAAKFVGGQSESFRDSSKKAKYVAGSRSGQISSRPVRLNGNISSSTITDKRVQSNKALYFYTDGSCLDNRDVINTNPKAGWGVVVIQSDLKASAAEGELVDELYGTVITDRNSPGFLGAEYGK